VNESRESRYIVGSGTDPLSVLQMERVLDLLREAHPRTEFLGYHEMKRGAGRKRGAGETERGLAWACLMLAKREIDIVITEASEIPLKLPAKIGLAAVLERDNPFDVFLSRDDLILDDQLEDSCIAVTDQVRKGQLLYYRSDLQVIECGDSFFAVSEMMNDGRINGFVFPASSIEAYNQQDKVVEVFTSSISTPIPGQGAIALLTRRDDSSARQMLRELNDSASETEIEIERQFLRRVSRDGKGPIGTLVSIEEEKFKIEAVIAAPDGSEKVSGAMGGLRGDEAKVIDMLASELLASGGKKILAAFRK
jgi:hydroxymethylbilane synthase